MNEPPKRLKIQALLDEAVQPFPDLTSEERRSLGVSMGRRGQRMLPVALGEDGCLVDGSQRLNALLAQGTKMIAVEQTVTLKGVTRRNALEWGIRLNAQRRQLTGQQKADLARQLMHANAWSQGRIADVFGVSQPAVSQWLKQYPADGEEPEEVEGVDGITRKVSRISDAQKERHEKNRTEDTSPPRALDNLVRDGKSYTARLVNLETEGLNPLQRAKLRQMLEHLSDALEGVLEQTAAPDLADLEDADEDDDEILYVGDNLDPDEIAE